MNLHCFPKKSLFIAIISLFSMLRWPPRPPAEKDEEMHRGAGMCTEVPRAQPGRGKDRNTDRDGKGRRERGKNRDEDGAGTGTGQGRARPGGRAGKGPAPPSRSSARGGLYPARGWNRCGAGRPHPEPGRRHRALFVRSPGSGWDKAGGVPRVRGSRALSRGHGEITVTLLGRCHRQPGPVLRRNTNRPGCVASRLAREQPDRCGDLK